MAQFTFETVDVPGTVHGQAWLALDKNNNPHISYVSSDLQLMLASRDANGEWSIEKVFSAGLVRGSDENPVVLEIDSEGNPHVTYIGYSTGHLIYGVKRNDQWTFTPVPTNRFNNPGNVSHFAFRLHAGRLSPELRDTPHFAFHDLTSDALGYTRKVDGQFKRMIVAERSGFDVGRFPSMAFDDSSGTFLIAYTEERDEGGPEPHTRVLATRINDPYEGTIGFTSLIEDGYFRVVRPTSIVSETEWCVAYADITNNRLKASVFDLSLPELHQETVAETVFAVVPSLARAPGSDNYRIAFGDKNTLKLASRNRFGEWVIEVVDPDGGVMPSLTYDHLGNAHIVYMVGNTLKYAKGTGVRFI
ncbi:hypothetical protein CBR59_30480 [Bacillus thuringiensis]|uniref:hypothetical protein n=1 Tax=Bacillus thuringiensis TaxID=1428 RepID=UPI000C9DF3F8|nr:hypothetical protein [Bacillus thuringiensis]PNK22628.1 hypothetical protein CBP87_30770 [Bacillus thuringiensis]PNK45805.1 hypothetical protein CBR59_30480 [Bacillus thuringiensis]